MEITFLAFQWLRTQKAMHGKRKTLYFVSDHAQTEYFREKQSLVMNLALHLTLGKQGYTTIGNI